MIKSIKIYNRFNMEMFAKTDGLNFPYRYWYLISIYGDRPLMTEKTTPVFNQIGLQGYISLNFWDIDDKSFKEIRASGHPEVVLFTKQQASEIIAFLDVIQKDIKDSVLVIHCKAGISRSGAVGTFVCDYCRLNYSEFIKENRGVCSNQYILNILRRKANIMPFSGIIINDGIDWDEINRIGKDRFHRLVLKRRT